MGFGYPKSFLTLMAKKTLYLDHKVLGDLCEYGSALRPADSSILGEGAEVALFKDEKIIEEKTLTGYCRVDFVGGTTDLGLCIVT